MQRTSSSASSSRGSFGSVCSTIGDEDVQCEPSPSSNTGDHFVNSALQRKNAKKMHSSNASFDASMEEENRHYPRCRAYSVDSSLSPYNPERPLIKNFPIRKPQISHLRNVRSIKTTIGPLTKEVCERLNIPLELDDHSKQLERSCLQLKVPDNADDKIFSVEVKEATTLLTVKEDLITKLKELYPETTWNFIHDYQFVYTIDGKDYQLLDDFQYICISFLYQHYLHKKSFPLIEVRKKCLHTKEEHLLFDKIHAITNLNTYRSNSRDSGVYDTTQMEEDDEMVWAKLTLQSFAIEVARYRDPVRYSMLTELDHSPVTTHLANKIPNAVITLFIHAQKVLTIERSFDVNSTATRVLAEVFPCIETLNLLPSPEIDQYTLQVTGEDTYINGDIRLLDFKAVRRAIFKGKELHLSVVSKPSSLSDQLYDLNWPLVDPFTGTAPTHDYITDSARSVNMTNGISLWDMTFPFKICVKKISNVPRQHYQKDTNVEIEIGLYVGGRPLTEAVKTSVTKLKECTTWNEIITFDFDTCAMPKATRLFIVVKEDKKMKRKSSDCTAQNLELYWAAVSLIDYRNILKVGKQKVCMWSTPRLSSKDVEDPEMFYCEPNPIGTIANNPNPSAVQLTLEFESWAHPIIFPNDVLESNPRPRTSSVGNYDYGISQITTVLNNNEAIAKNLQAYIERVDWSDPQHLSEIYYLLSHLKEPLPLVVAFRFLDSNCPDEFVRAFAVERLRQVEDDKLMDCLLQLVQALKFEANHNSALARFLLERAVQNKLIGHFFFWYCRCEAQNPQFAARYNTLLEAYFVGCGKDMLDNFVDQVSSLDYFQMISRELKKAKSQTASDGQKVLKQLFNKYKFDSNKTVLPAYNSRLRLGNLDPRKCKVMQSKKMPMWLWMSNVHPSTLQPVPHKLIMKNGDDLRQDMLTLQMLNLFDKIWQEDGLDLCLIPYGCIATSPDSGFIEVVKDARTIADISGVRDSTKLLQWIKEHQKDQFGEEDLDLLQSAINRFVRSCAGYSVATYVLGIGDRHNDNIMVTTSGNLFHIDFGHFLGNVKHFLKIKREWCPFVLTPDFIHVMGGERSVTFTEFRSLCTKAFLSLRRNADLIINLFSMMRYTGIPELTCVEDIDYLRNALMVTKDDFTAKMEFEKILDKCIRLGWTVQISWWAHVVRGN